MKKLLIGLLAGLAILSAALVYGVIDLYRYMHAPMHGNRASAVYLHIEQGDNFKGIMQKLQDKQLVTHPWKFELVARWKGFARNLQAGEYRISPQMTPLEVLGSLSRGKVVLHRVTIPEGFNIRQVARRLDEKGLADADAFLGAATDPQLAQQLNIPADTVEGYLFPDTYAFARSVSPEKIIRTMTGQLRQHFPPEWRERARNMDFSVHEIITLASIIEKETGAPEERKIIASVFHNRLEKNMRLETDPTVIYGIENFDGNLTREHLRRHSPYNTYRIRGLPPGPIANPGLASIRAALYPADTDFLFFVSRKDGTHQFSETLKAHNQAVRKYQLTPGRP